MLPRSNFDYILFAFTTVYHCINGDQWNIVWYNCIRGIGEGFAHPYFLVLMIIGKIIFMNAFVSIMLGNFEEARKRAEEDRTKAESVIKTLQKSRNS